MAQDAGIQLQVGFDLAYFRSRLVDLQAVTTGTKLSFGVAFKRLDIQNELNALATNIKKRNYFLEVKTNLAAEIKNAKDLATALDNLARSSSAAKASVGKSLGVGAIGRKPSEGGLGSADVKKLYRASARAGLLAFDEEIARTKVSMVAAMEAVGIDAIEGLLNGLNSQDPRLQAAARYIGETLIKVAKTSLGIASPSKEFEKIGKNVGEGFEKGALSSMDKAFDALENKMRQRGKILDTVARGIFRMLGMDPAAMLQQAREQRAASVRTPIAGLLPSFTSRGTREETIRQLREGGPSVAQGPGMLALSNEALGRRVSAILQEYFKVAEVQVRESFDPRELKQSLNVFSYIAQSLRDAESRTKQARVAESVDSLMNAINQSIKMAEASARVRLAQVRELPRRPDQAMLPGTRIAGLLSPESPGRYRASRTGETQAELFARREREARMRSALREMDVLGGGAGRPASPYSYVNRAARPRNAMVPYAAGGALVPMGGGAGGGLPPRPPSGGGGMGGAGGFGRALQNINLPGTGVVREIGEEFAMATKQVLLFGTAYKALAFATSFPAQVGQAVGALQSFNNTLKAISPSAAEAKASNQFILDIVDRYNVPLQSARNGFTKLYASMAPAGFKGDEIRALFTGVSQAAATFGMSAEKVDRVNYAFAQMASKGQVMSEELKGQLGDVLPGAMGIFAEAAGFKGPKAIEQFSKALEDGAYKGDAMRSLLKNVTGVLQKEFGPGAEGAARTFQGVINRMQNSTQLLYEAFEPVAVGFLNSVVVPLTSGIKTITDGFNAFFTGTQAKTAGGMAFAKELEALRPTFEGIQANLAALIPSFQLFGGVLLNVAKFLATVAGNPITGFLLKVYTNVLLVNTVFTLLGGRILVGLIANIGLATSRFIAMNAAVFALQRTSAVTNSTLAGTQLQMLLLQRNATGAIGPVNALLGSLLRLAGIGTIAIVVSVAVTGMAAIYDAQAKIDQLRGARKAGGATAAFGGSATTEQKKAQQGVLAAIKTERESPKYKAEQAAAAAGVGKTFARQRADLLAERERSARAILALPTRKTTPTTPTVSTVPTTPIGNTGSSPSGAAKDKKTRESQLPMLRLELEKAKELFAIDQQLIGARLADNASLVSSLELQKQLTELKYQGKQIALEQIPLNEKQAKMAALAVEYEKAIMESQLNLQLDMQKAREDLQRSVEDTVKGYELENEYQQRYYELVQQGISPALAKIRVEIEKTFRKEKERVDTLIEQYELQKASLKVQLYALLAQDNLSDIDSKRLADIKERIKLLDLELEKMGLLKGGLPSAQAGAITTAEGAAQPAPASVRLQELADESKLALEKLLDPVEQIKTISETVSESIGSAFKGLITGATTAQEALANVFQSIADSFADMVAQIITEWLRAQLIKGLGQILNLFVPGAGAITGAIGGGLSSGFSAGASSAIDTSAAGWGAAFNTNLQFANGGIAPGGFRAFANGGIVSGPTLGLVGEGRYNEAVIPLPDGKSVPVDLGGAMGGQAVNNIVVNVDAKGSKVEGNDQEGKQLGRVVAAAVQQELIKQKRPGGLLF
jgi:tape measure domain-containing protein